MHASDFETAFSQKQQPREERRPPVEIEPVKEGLRVIIEDEIAMTAPETGVIERIQPKVSAAEKNAQETARLPKKPTRFPRPLIVAANDIRSGDITIRLTGIKAPSRGETCKGATTQNPAWPCGNFAKAALQRLVRTRTLDCDGKYTSEKVFEGRCKAGKTDISEWLVEQGWARSSAAEFTDLMKAAKREEKGLWRSGVGQ